MYTFEFKAKLKRLNPALYVREDNAVPVSKDWRVASLYMRRNKRSAIKTDVNYLQSDAANFLRNQEDGHFDEHVCGVPAGWVPEHDVFELEEGRQLASGWRTIVAKLLQKKLTSPDLAKKVFGYVPCDYDRQSFAQRLARARNEKKECPPQFQALPALK